MQDFLSVGESKSARCDDLESLKARKCAVTKIENPRGFTQIDLDKPVTNRKKDVAEKLKPEQITQIQPQKLTLTLRSGKYLCLVVDLQSTFYNCARKVKLQLLLFWQT